MRNELAVVIRRASTAIGAGLLEEALEQEGGKGCSPILCTSPVRLEPPYRRFDAARVLARHAGTEDEPTTPTLPPADLVTLDVYPAAEDELSITWMETMLRALAVLPRPMAFELSGTAGKVWVRLAVPEDQVAGLQASLLGHFPALRLRAVERPFPATAPVAVNELVPIAPYHRSLTLLGKEGASPLGLATIVLSALGEGEHGLFQVVLCPADPAHDWHFNVGNMVEAELRAVQHCQLGGLSSRFAYDPTLPPLLEPSVREKVRVDVAFFAVVARYAVWSSDATTVAAFLQGMRVATGMVRFGNRAWRVLSHEDLVRGVGAAHVQKMVVERLTHRPGVMLTSREVASMVHLPNSRTLTMLPSIAQRAGLAWQSPEDTGWGSACLGTNTYAGESRSVEVPLGTRLRHTYVAGATGTGKSKLLERVAVDDAFNDLGFCLVDPHGDLCRDVLSRLPHDRLRDLVYVSFAEPGLVPRWNPFTATGVPAGKLADDLTRAFLAQTTTTGPRMEHHFRMLSYVVCTLGGTLDDFAELAGRTEQGELLREQALATISNPQAQRFLRRELPHAAPRELSSVTNKLSRLLLDDNLGVMFRQEQNELHPRRWMDESSIVLVNLSSGHIGSDHARFVGSLFVSLIYRAALTRSDIPLEERRPFILYIDEFQALQAATLKEVLSEGRKYGLAAVLAHQERGQLGKELAQALGNCATKVIFRPTEDDLPFVLRLLGGRVDADTVRTLGVGDAMVASGNQVASLRTELCARPRVRDPRDAAQRYAQAHYRAVDAVAKRSVRRPRVYDTFGEEQP